MSFLKSRFFVFGFFVFFGINSFGMEEESGRLCIFLDAHGKIIGGKGYGTEAYFCEKDVDGQDFFDFLPLHGSDRNRVVTAFRVAADQEDAKVSVAYGHGSLACSAHITSLTYKTQLVGYKVQIPAQRVGE